MTWSYDRSFRSLPSLQQQGMVCAFGKKCVCVCVFVCVCVSLVTRSSCIGDCPALAVSGDLPVACYISPPSCLVWFVLCVRCRLAFVPPPPVLFERSARVRPPSDSSICEIGVETFIVCVRRLCARRPRCLTASARAAAVLCSSSLFFHALFHVALPPSLRRCLERPA